MDQESPASGLRVFAEFAVLPAAAGDTSPAGETIRRPTDARSSRGYRITEVPLSQRLVVGGQAHRLYRAPRDECVVRGFGAARNIG